MFSTLSSHWTVTKINPTKSNCTAVVSNNFALVYEFNIIISFYVFFAHSHQHDALQEQFDLIRAQSVLICRIINSAEAYQEV